MKYYLIAGEASGDLHASHLMTALRRADEQAEFRFVGGDLMAAVGGTCVRHYREMAYMGFIPVLMHLPEILRAMTYCQRDIVGWQPDCLILVDYPGFNLRMAKYVKQHTQIPVYYYISPKIWAWKERRIKSIRRYVDELFSILPFEVDFFERRHHYPIHYVGNPSAEEVGDFRRQHPDAAAALPLTGDRPIIALLAGSRRQEIKDNLPAMLDAAMDHAADHRLVVAGAPGIPDDYYARFIAGRDVQLVSNQTFALLAGAHAALVTSGTATLETALFGVPQVVCYKTPLPPLVGFLRRHLLKVPYVSLVNLIAGREVVRELVADTFSVTNIRRELQRVLQGPDRTRMLADYDELRRTLGERRPADEAARTMVRLLAGGQG